MKDLFPIHLSELLRTLLIFLLIFGEGSWGGRVIATEEAILVMIYNRNTLMTSCCFFVQRVSYRFYI